MSGFDVPDFTQVDLPDPVAGGGAGRAAWAAAAVDAPASWETPEGIDVAPLYSAADVEGLDKTEDVIPHILGGGGSDFSPAFDRLRGEGNTSVVVAFTDGYISVPSTQPETLKGVLWVITDRGQRPCSWGAGIKLDKDGYAEEM